jgi:cytosolic carboxypeptidase protein 5
MTSHETIQTMPPNGIELFADFDSGNMARYDRVTKCSQITTNPTEQEPNATHVNETLPNGVNHSLSKYDVEFNVWTRRDCEGTPHENANRSWFYFGVRGGYGKHIRLNIMNLNRQARLFEMGMLPVFRTVPGHEKWTRLQSRMCWETVNEDFKLSFVHYLPDIKNSVTFFAFCFPHSYEDMQTLLDKYDTCYNANLADHYLEQNLVPIQSADIYYHRETLCYSCDRLKVDLLTITSYKGKANIDDQSSFAEYINASCFQVFMNSVMPLIEHGSILSIGCDQISFYVQHIRSCSRLVIDLYESMIEILFPN